MRQALMSFQGQVVLVLCKTVPSDDELSLCKVLDVEKNTSYWTPENTLSPDVKNIINCEYFTSIDEALDKTVVLELQGFKPIYFRTGDGFGVAWKLQKQGTHSVALVS